MQDAGENYGVKFENVLELDYSLTLVFPGGVGGKGTSCQLRKLETED